MAEMWIPYLRVTGKTPVGCLVSVGERELAGRGDPDRPLLTLVHVMFRDADEHGMGTGAEIGRLDDAWDGLWGELEQTGAMYVARLRRGGRATYCVYSAPGQREAVAGLVRRAFAGEQVSLEQKDDARWEAYKSVLPTRAEERGVEDLRVIQVLEQHGDPLTPARDVRHYVYFPDQQSARRFQGERGGEGFKTDLRGPEGDATQWCVVVSRDDSVTPEAITPITATLCEQAEALGGEYDGWEAALVKGKPKGLFSKLFGSKG